MTPLFFGSALLATLVSAYGMIDAYLTLVALNESKLAADRNARLLARGGIRTAALRTAQMLGLVHAAVVSLSIEPRPHIAAGLYSVWAILAVVCWVSTVKELLAMWDRRNIVIDEVRA